MSKACVRAPCKMTRRLTDCASIRDRLEVLEARCASGPLGSMELIPHLGICMRGRGRCLSSSAKEIGECYRLAAEARCHPCPYRKLNPDVLMVQTPEVRVGYDAANGLKST